MELIKTHASLFSGIGGFDLAAEWMGWENTFHCEINKFGQRVLKYYWPNAISYDDITQTDFTIWRGKIDILTGGFPCQPYSLAGQRKGKEDDRHLWPEMLRAIREIAPRFIVGENVYGLVNWDGGLVFEEVQADLEAEGYEVQPVILPASGVNAPHRRDRIWFVSYANKKRFSDGNEIDSKHKIQGIKKRLQNDREVSGLGCDRITSYTNSNRQQRQRGTKGQISSEKKANWQKYRAVDDGRWPLESPVYLRDDGFSSRLDGITLRKWREETIQGAGNAIVPQVAYEIFKALEHIINQI
jgi:DNA (cytosine-5)-methyltransferase 1